MNKTIKIVLIVALCLFAVGLLVFFGSSIVTGYRLSDIGQPDNDAAIAGNDSYDIIEKEAESGRQDIEIEVSFANVTLSPSKDGKIHLTYTEGGKISFDYQADSEKITLKQTTNSFSFLGTIADSARVELLLPENHAGDLEIDSASGIIKLRDISITGDLELSSASGSITAENCSCKEYDCSTVSGEISLRNAQLSELEAASRSGGITLTDVSAVSCSLENTSGACDLDGVDASRIRVGTISGGIRGTLAGASEDYTISTKNISGANSLLNLGGRGERVLTVTTTSGDIELGFAR